MANARHSGPIEFEVLLWKNNIDFQSLKVESVWKMVLEQLYENGAITSEPP